MATRKPTVYVLDDDPAILDSLSALLHVMEFPAEFYSTVDDFLEVFDPSRLGCLLLDLRLPGDGMELLRMFSNSRYNQPIIVVTGHGDEQTREMAIRLGAAAYFEKPCNNHALCECIRRLIYPTT